MHIAYAHATVWYSVSRCICGNCENSLLAAFYLILFFQTWFSSIAMLVSSLFLSKNRGKRSDESFMSPHLHISGTRVRSHECIVPRDLEVKHRKHLALPNWHVISRNWIPFVFSFWRQAFELCVGHHRNAFYSRTDCHRVLSTWPHSGIISLA